MSAVMTKIEDCIKFVFVMLFSLLIGLPILFLNVFNIESGLVEREVENRINFYMNDMPESKLEGIFGRREGHPPIRDIKLHRNLSRAYTKDEKLRELFHNQRMAILDFNLSGSKMIDMIHNEIKNNPNFMSSDDTNEKIRETLDLVKNERREFIKRYLELRKKLEEEGHIFKGLALFALDNAFLSRDDRLIKFVSISVYRTFDKDGNITKFDPDETKRLVMYERL